MNMMPPMVGVPALELCHCGPTSRMDWPACSARSMGKTKRPNASVSKNETSVAPRTIKNIASILDPSETLSCKLQAVQLRLFFL